MEKDSLLRFQPLVRKETSNFVSALIEGPGDFVLHTKRCVEQVYLLKVGCLPSMSLGSWAV